MCGTGGGRVFNTAIYPLMAYAAIATGILIAISYMAGTALSNPKLTLWAKTELVQLGVSIASVAIILFAVNAFCIIDMKEIADMFGLSGSHASINVYDAAKEYLKGAALYSHNALTVARYHLEGYTVLSYFNAFICDFPIGRIGLGCLFGYAGDTQQPFGGYGADIAAMNVFFNGMIMAHFTALNFLFILLFIYKGFVFLFLPLGIFLRALPFMRPVGSVLIAIALSFLTVYPFTLGVFYLMGDVLLDRGTGFAPPGIDMSKYDESIYPDSTNAASQMGVSTGGEAVAKCNYFGTDRGSCIGYATANEFGLGGVLKMDQSYFGRENPVGAIGFAANAFIAAIFFPTVALLTAIASVSYMARLMGEEIDLSRITQLV
jgi:hypothetical protein